MLKRLIGFCALAVSGCSSGDVDADSSQANVENCSDMRVCVDHMRVTWMGVCVASSAEEASAGLHTICLVNDKGDLGVAQVRGDKVVTNARWTHSSYGTGAVASTLSPDNEARCTEALEAITDWSACE